MYSILNNKIADYYRKKYREADKVDYTSFEAFFDSNGEWKAEKRPQAWGADEIQLLDDLEFIEILKYCVEHLPDKWEVAVQMKYYGNMKSEFICKELGVSTTNFWQILHRARLNLRECIESNWFNEN